MFRDPEPDSLVLRFHRQPAETALQFHQRIITELDDADILLPANIEQVVRDTVGEEDELHVVACAGPSCPEVHRWRLH